MNFHKLNVIVANSPTGSSSDSSSGSNRSDSSSEDDDDGDRVSNKSQSEDVETISSEGKDKNDDTPTQELVLNVETDVKSSILPVKDKLSTKLYHNKAGEFFTGFDPTSVEFKTKTEERIRRFGQIISPDYLLTEQSLKELYSSLGVPGPKETSSESTQALHATTDITNDNISENIDGNDNNNIRYNTIYLRGTNEMSTKDVFNYFKQFPPSAVEWINDESCNVVWLENITACRAMLHLSKEITKKSMDDIEVDKKNEEIDGGNNNKNISNNDNNNNNNSGEGGVIISGNQITDDINDEVKERGLKNKSRKKFDEDNFDLMSDDDEQDEEEKMDVDDEDNDNNKEDENTDTNKQNDTNSEINTTTTTTNINDDNNINDESKKEEDNDSGKDDIASSVFNGMKYREGQPYKNAGELYMRFATKDDRKELGASNKSKYYQKYGNPNFGGLKGLISTSHKKRHLAWKREKVLKKVRREIEEIEWMTKGVPEVTKFDKHISETKLPDVRERVRKRRMIPHYGDDGGDDGDDDNQSTEVVIGNEEEEEDNDSQGNVDDEDNDNKSNVSDSEDDVKMSKRSKIPRMKMYADEYNDERMHHHRSHHHHQSENKPVTSRLGKRKDPYHSPHHSPNHHHHSPTHHHHSPTHHHHSPTHHRPHSSSLLSAKSRLGIRVTTDNEHYHRHHHHHKQQHQQSKDGVKSRLGKR